MSYSFFEKPDKFESIGDDIQKEVLNRLKALDKFKDSNLDSAPDPDVKKALALTKHLLVSYKEATSVQLRGKSVSTEAVAEEDKSADHTTLSRPQ